MGIRAGVAADSLGFTIFAAECHTKFIITAAGGKFNLFGGNSRENLILSGGFEARLRRGGQAWFPLDGGPGGWIGGKKGVFGNWATGATKFWKTRARSTY